MQFYKIIMSIQLTNNTTITLTYIQYMYLQMLIIWPLWHISLCEVTEFKPIDIIMLYSAACSCLKCNKVLSGILKLSKHDKRLTSKVMIKNLSSAISDTENRYMNNVKLQRTSTSKSATAT